MRRARRRWATPACCVAAAVSLVMAAGCGSSPKSATAPATSSSGQTDVTTGSSPAASGASINGNAATLEAAGYKGTYTAPPTNGPPAQKGKNVWIISCGQASESCSVPADAAQQAGQMLGWKVTLFDAQLNPANYTVGIDKAIALDDKRYEGYYYRGLASIQMGKAKQAKPADLKQLAPRDALATLDRNRTDVQHGRSLALVVERIARNAFSSGERRFRGQVGRPNGRPGC